MASGSGRDSDNDHSNNARNTVGPRDMLVWLGPDGRLVPRSQITNETIESLHVLCTSCGEQINHHNSRSIYIHQKLNVVLCRSCYRYIGDGNFQKDDNGADEYCTWCAEGGKLVVCDSCSRAFCTKCIRRNLSRKELSRVDSSEVWTCYVCDPSPISGLVNYATMLKDFCGTRVQSKGEPCSSAAGGDSYGVDPVELKKRAREVKSKAILGASSLLLSLKKLEEENSPAALLKMQRLLKVHVQSISKLVEGTGPKSRRRPKRRGSNAELTEEITKKQDALEIVNVASESENERTVCPLVDSSEEEVEDEEPESKTETKETSGNKSDSEVEENADPGSVTTSRGNAGNVTGSEEGKDTYERQPREKVQDDSAKGGKESFQLDSDVSMEDGKEDIVVKKLKGNEHSPSVSSSKSEGKAPKDDASKRKGVSPESCLGSDRELVLEQNSSSFVTMPVSMKDDGESVPASECENGESLLLELPESLSLGDELVPATTESDSNVSSQSLLKDLHKQDNISIDTDCTPEEKPGAAPGLTNTSAQLIPADKLSPPVASVLPPTCQPAPRKVQHGAITSESVQTKAELAKPCSKASKMEKCTDGLESSDDAGGDGASESIKGSSDSDPPPSASKNAEQAFPLKSNTDDEPVPADAKPGLAATEFVASEASQIVADMVSPPVASSLPPTCKSTSGTVEQSTTTAKHISAEAAVARPDSKMEKCSDSIESSDDAGGDGASESTKGFSSSDPPSSASKRATQATLRKKRSPLSKSEKARHALFRSLLYSPSSEEELSDKGDTSPSKLPHFPRATTSRYRGRKEARGEQESSLVTSSHCENMDTIVSGFDDPKLLLKVMVVVQQLPVSKEDLKAAMEMGNSRSRSRRKSDDDISSLLTLPRKRRKRSCPLASHSDGGKPCKKRGRRSSADVASSEEDKPTNAAARKTLCELDADFTVLSGSDSSDKEADEKQKEAARTVLVPNKDLKKLQNEMSKAALLESILDTSPEDSDDEGKEGAAALKKAAPKMETPKKATKSKTENSKKVSDTEENEKQEDCVVEDEEQEKIDEVAKEKEESSSDKEVVTKKKNKLHKYEKLLRERITDKEDQPKKEEEDPQEGGAAKKKKSEKRKSTRTRKLQCSDDEDDEGKAVSEQSSSSSSSSDSSEEDSDFLLPSSTKRKGRAAVKGSDSESDDSDFQVVRPRPTRKKKKSSNSDSGRPKKKLSRIKVAVSTEGSNDDDSDCVEILNSSQDQDAKGRKNIRKLISDKRLTDKTKAAAHAEEERKRRIQERQKLYNQIRGDGPAKATLSEDRLVLELDVQTKEAVVEVHSNLVKCMKPHQAKGVKFMYDCTIESIEMLKKDPSKGSGCILAHCMGLGKSFQVISFLHTIMTHKELGKHIKTALVVCPYNTVLNWVQEFERWIDDKDLDLNVFEFSAIKDRTLRLEVLERWQRKGGVAILGYDMFRNLVNDKAKRVPKRQKERLRSALLDPGPNIVICDEGHVLKNDATGLAKSMNLVKTGRRIVLTGTPLQNNLIEYHCMVQFVKPNLLGTKKEFRNRFGNPIANGACADSTLQDVKLMKKRVHILHRLLDGCVQRCDYSALAPFLPPKCEYVISVRLSDVQVALYRHFLEHLARGGRNQKLGGTSLFWDFNMLRNIWSHPMLLKMGAERTAAKEMLENTDEEEDADNSFIDDRSNPSESDCADDDDVVCLDKDDQPSTSRKDRSRKSGDSEEEVVKTWNTRSRRVRSGNGSTSEDTPEPPAPEKKKEWWDQYISEEDMEKLEMSGKMSLLYNILQECDSIGDKVLLFSQSLLVLNMVEKMLERCDERATSVNPNTALLDPNDPMRDCHNTWVAGIDYFRMDGSTSVELRKRWIEMFNNEDNPRGRLFLISTRAGSLGTNLVGANRVVIMDASWNPTHDIQAIFRVYRFGQKKPVFIYRFLAQGTMEEKIYDRQVNKQSLSCRVVDEQQIERHFNAADLQELYTFSPDSKSNRPTPMVPKDRLLAELLIRNKDVIVSYHEHDSLLQNITEEDLTEEERKTAWEEYKDEREGRINMDNGLGGTFLNQQGVPMASWVLDVSKIVTEIRAREPHLTSEQVIFRLKGALVAYRDHFRRQQMKAFEKRTEYIRLKQPVPQEIAAQLSESAKSIEQINKVLLKMENMPQPSAQQRWQGQQGMPQQGMPQQGMPQQGMPQQGAPFQQRMPQQPTQRGQPFQGVKQQGMPQSRRQPQQQAPPPNFGSQYFTAAYNLALSRGVDPGSARSYAMFHRDQIWKQMNGIPAQPEPVVVEADENAGPQRRAPQPQPSNSSVVITEISD